MSSNTLPFKVVFSFPFSFGISPVEQQLQDMSELPADWDSYGAYPPTALALDTARTLIHQAARHSVVTAPPDHLSPLPNGGVFLQWMKGPSGDKLIVDIDGDGAIGYLLASSLDGKRHYKEQNTVDLPSIIKVITGFLTPWRSVHVVNSATYRVNLERRRPLQTYFAQPPGQIWKHHGRRFLWKREQAAQASIRRPGTFDLTRTDRRRSHPLRYVGGSQALSRQSAEVQLLR